MSIETERKTGIAEKTPAVQSDVPSPPPLYQVVLVNDDYTPMDFVVEILEMVFGLQTLAAEAVMLSIHQEGRGICGVFGKDVAESKAGIVKQIARKHNHPLLAIVELVP